jgi:hypothetical protein
MPLPRADRHRPNPSLLLLKDEKEANNDKTKGQDVQEHHLFNRPLSKLKKPPGWEAFADNGWPFPPYAFPTADASSTTRRTIMLRRLIRLWRIVTRS